jgi:hypothetical protein
LSDSGSFEVDVMKSLAGLFRPGDHASGQGIPAHRMDRVRGSFRRRLSDQLEEVFYRACSENDRRTAAGLFAVLEDLYIRRQQPGRDRRISDQAIAKAREALASCWPRDKQDGQTPDTNLPRSAGEV